MGLPGINKKGRPRGPAFFVHYLVSSCGRWASLQASILWRMGAKLCPMSVKVYSTRGGIS